MNDDARRIGRRSLIGPPLAPTNRVKRAGAALTAGVALLAACGGDETPAPTGTGPESLRASFDALAGAVTSSDAATVTSLIASSCSLDASTVAASLRETDEALAEVGSPPMSEISVEVQSVSVSGANGTVESLATLGGVSMNDGAPDISSWTVEDGRWVTTDCADYGGARVGAGATSADITATTAPTTVSAGSGDPAASPADGPCAITPGTEVFGRTPGRQTFDRSVVIRVSAGEEVRLSGFAGTTGGIGGTPDQVASINFSGDPESSEYVDLTALRGSCGFRSGFGVAPPHLTPLSTFTVYESPDPSSPSVDHAVGAEGMTTGRFDAGLTEVEMFLANGTTATGWVDPRVFMVGQE